MAEKIIGIDLGTSNSAASVMQGGKPTLIPAAEGTTVAGKAFPSVVAFSKDGELLVGEPARRQAVTNPDNTIREAKRKMGEDFLYKIQGKEYKPQQISAFILQKIKVSGFSIGFGPALFKKKINGITYSIRSLPLGGFVSFPDEETDSLVEPNDPDLIKN